MEGGAGEAKALSDHACARAMVFVENGRVVDRRSMMRAGTIADIFWGVLNTIYCFFHCMLSVCWPAPLPRVRPHPRARARGRRTHTTHAEHAWRVFSVRASQVATGRPCLANAAETDVQAAEAKTAPTGGSSACRRGCVACHVTAPARATALLTPAPALLPPTPSQQPDAASDFQAGKYQGPFGNGGPGSGGGWGGGGGGRGGRRGPNIAGVRRYDSMDAPPMGGG